jgi:hypothetical protein
MENTVINNKSEKSNLGLVSSIVSFSLHLLIFVAVALLFTLFESGTSSPGYYVEYTGIKGNFNNIPGGQPQVKENPAVPNPTDPKGETGKKAERTERNIHTKNENITSNGYANVTTTGFDSTNLSQIYKESTLNVTLKYPTGWVYMDQQKKNKLDGITFWSAAGDYNPPPYIHVEVVDKYMFIPDQYKYKYNFKDFEGYYNDPVELENQVTQVIYLKTNDDEDFIIKLIMNGRDQFNKFQPVFFSMVNSFKFGSSLF